MFQCFFVLDSEIPCDISSCVHGHLNKKSCVCICPEYWTGHVCGRSVIVSVHHRCLYDLSITDIRWIYIYIYIESLMSCHLLLNLLHELANMILCEALPSIISFLPTNVINLVINDNVFEILFIT